MSDLEQKEFVKMPSIRTLMFVAAGFAAGYFIAKKGVPGLPA